MNYIFGTKNSNEHSNENSIEHSNENVLIKRIENLEKEVEFLKSQLIYHQQQQQPTPQKIINERKIKNVDYIDVKIETGLI